MAFDSSVRDVVIAVGVAGLGKSTMIKDFCNLSDDDIKVSSGVMYQRM